VAINDVSLTAGMRSNLLSLQDTVNLLNRTQNRLSSGKKVNSAIDNPVSFFASQALTSRASIIDSLKDSMGQAVQTINSADKGIKAITAMIEQAKGIAQSALSADQSTGFSVGEVSLNGLQAGLTVGFATADINFPGSLTAADSISIGGIVFTPILGPTAGTDFQFGISGVQDAVEFASVVNNYDWSGEPATFSALRTNDVVTISKTVTAGGAGTNVLAGDIAITVATGGASSVIVPPTGTGGDQISIGGVTFTATTSGTPGAQEFLVSGDNTFDKYSLALVVNTYDWSFEAATFRASVSGGVLNLQKVDNATSLVANVLAGDFDASGVTGGGSSSMAVIAGDSELSNLQDQYNEMRAQLTAVAEDSGYKGKNLLSNTAALRSLNVQFEGNTLNVAGFSATAAGLNLTAAAWTVGGTAAIGADLDALDTALSTMRQNASRLAGNLSIITVRQDFSTNMINTLTEGSDKLTLADANEEGANMLMLQTRQSLSTSALSMSAQAAQSVLRLFQ
jgi:flagellin